MYLKRYNFYRLDTGDYVIMDDEFDLQLARCHSREMVENIVYALNEIDLEDPNEVTKIH